MLSCLPMAAAVMSCRAPQAPGDIARLPHSPCPGKSPQSHRATLKLMSCSAKAIAAAQTDTGQSQSIGSGCALILRAKSIIFPSFAAPHLPLKLRKHAVPSHTFWCAKQLALSIRPQAHSSVANRALTVPPMNPSARVCQKEKGEMHLEA